MRQVELPFVTPACIGEDSIEDALVFQMKWKMHVEFLAIALDLVDS